MSNPERYEPFPSYDANSATSLRHHCYIPLRDSLHQAHPRLQPPGQVPSGDPRSGHYRGPIQWRSLCKCRPQPSKGETTMCSKTVAAFVTSIASGLFVCLGVLAGCSGSTRGNFGGGNPPPPNPTVTSVSVSCSPASISTGATSTCSAAVQGTGSYSSAVSWTATNGTISATGVTLPPENIPHSELLQS